jgi:hypothetical protein
MKPELQDLYKNHVEKHNRALVTDPFPNSGFDLFVPENTVVDTVNIEVPISLTLNFRKFNSVI